MRVFLVALQRSESFSQNFKLNPARSFIGWATLMADSYVVSDIQLQFYSQLIYASLRQDLQNHVVSSANLSVIFNILSQLTLENPQPPNIIVWPPPSFQPLLPPESHIQFVLEPDWIIQVVTQYVPMYLPPEFEYDPYEEEPPNGSLNTENNPPIPPSPPGSPPNGGLPGSESLFEISPPYDGINDNGKTYVPPFLPPWEGDDGQDPLGRYTVTVRYRNFNPNGTPQSNSTFNVIKLNVPGKIQGLGTQNSANPDAAYGILSNGTVSSEGYLGPNYQFKIAWPYPEFTSYTEASIIQVLKQN